jgi:hypothetical protein
MPIENVVQVVEIAGAGAEVVPLHPLVALKLG